MQNIGPIAYERNVLCLHYSGICSYGLEASAAVVKRSNTLCTPYPWLLDIVYCYVKIIGPI